MAIAEEKQFAFIFFIFIIIAVTTIYVCQQLSRQNNYVNYNRSHSGHQCTFWAPNNGESIWYCKCGIEAYWDGELCWPIDPKTGDFDKRYLKFRGVNDGN